MQISWNAEADALADKMEAAGLCDVYFKPLTLGVATLYVGTKSEIQMPATDEHR